MSQYPQSMLHWSLLAFMGASLLYEINREHKTNISKHARMMYMYIMPNASYTYDIHIGPVILTIAAQPASKPIQTPSGVGPKILENTACVNDIPKKRPAIAMQ